MKRSWQHKCLVVLKALAIILVVLLGVWWAAPPLNGNAPNSHAQALVGRNGPMAKGLDLFKFDVGRYPTTAESLGALFSAPPDVDNWQGPYVGGSATEFADPWNHAFIYRCPAKFSDRGYDLWSVGPDGIDAGGAPDSDDIANWKKGSVPPSQTSERSNSE